RTTWCPVLASIPANKTHHPDQNHRTKERGNETDQQSAATDAEHGRKQPPADEGADHADNDIHEDSVPMTAHDPPGQGARDTADDQEHDELHTCFLLRTETWY